IAGLELEDEAATVFLQLRKRAKQGGRILAISSHLTRGLAKLGAELIPTVPGQEAAAIAALADLGDEPVLLLGERLAGVPGAFSAARAQGARIGWIPRRAGDRSAAEAGCLPNHGGADGRDTTAILAAAASGAIGALVVGGVEVNDLPDPTTARYALEKAFVVSLEVRASEVTALADVVLPVAPPVEKAGSFVGWDGNWRAFPRVLESPALSDARVLRGMADELGKSLQAVPTADELDHDFGQLTVEPAPAPVLKAGHVVLSTWKQLIDHGRCQDGQPEYHATARPAVLKANAATLAAAGIAPGQKAVIGTSAGSATFPAVADETMVDGVVWAPTNNGQHLGAFGMHHGSVVTLGGAE
ncbi:MAG TPA: molybdopterin dinucleotide binding domain-containing protein, partial [Nonomuraea sp.]|nr:molybdopterin dinucleotide binding domain-containing protein [Nonomuraea sp.]